MFQKFGSSKSIFPNPLPLTDYPIFHMEYGVVIGTQIYVSVLMMDIAFEIIPC